jgi:hypothetical protein
MTMLTKTAFARSLGLSHQRIFKLVREGMPVTSLGLVDTEKAKAWIREHVGLRYRYRDRGRGRLEPAWRNLI